LRGWAALAVVEAVVEDEDEVAPGAVGAVLG
jgi:hypothetical protein